MSDILAAAARRARYTGLPLDRVIKSEQARRLRQINAGQIPASLVHQSPVDEAPLGEQERKDLNAPVNLGDGTAIIGGQEHTFSSKLDSEKVEKPKRKSPAKSKVMDAVADATAEAKGEPEKKEPSAADVADATKVASTSIPQPSAEEIVALSKKRNNIGKAVTYIDPFKKEKTGKIAHVIPSNVLPSELNIEAKGSKRRDHISYVVETPNGTMVWPASTATDIGMNLVPTAPAA